MSLADLVRVKCAFSIAMSILEAKSFNVSRWDSLKGCTLSLGFCLVSSMKGEVHVKACTQSLEANLAMDSHLY